jgi:AmmeMemoRadiSam system protein B
MLPVDKKIKIVLAAATFVAAAWFGFRQPFPNGHGGTTLAPSASGTTLGYVHPIYPFDREGFVSGERESKAQPPFVFPSPIRGGLIPHHVLPSALLTGFFRELAKQQPETVILIGPNHPDAGQKKLLTSGAPWETPFGRVQGNAAKADILLRLPFAGVDEDVIAKEHSVAGIMPFLKHFLPDAMVVPVVLNSHLTPGDIRLLSETLGDAAGGRTVVIAAVDFSHYLPEAVAEGKDRETEPLLRTFDSQAILPLGNDHVDSPVSIAVLLETMKMIDATHFDLYANTNSGKLLSDMRSGTTSYFFAGFSGGTSPLVVSPSGRGAKPRILFGGDMMFDRYIRTVIRTRGENFIFSPLRETLAGADAVVANLEGPITGSGSESETSVIGEAKNYVFTFPSETAALLKNEHIGIVNLGNNHILNFREDGAAQTERFLTAAGVEYFGSPVGSDGRILRKTFGGTKIAFVNYNQFVFQGKEKAFEDIRSARASADIVAVYAHWGKEYVPALPEIKDLAHRFIDAGADVIIGSHPHVVQEREVYAGKTIYYSLGNFIFDQYEKAETTQGLLVGMSIDPATKALSFEDIPIVLRNTGQTALAEGDLSR